MLRADAQFRGRQATFKRYSATSIDELHPRHNARDVLRRRKKFLGYTDLRTPIPSFDTADAATAASSVRETPDDAASECHADGRKRKDYAGGEAKRRYHGMVNGGGAASPSWTPRPRATRSSWRGSPRTTAASVGSGPATYKAWNSPRHAFARTCDARPGCLSEPVFVSHDRDPHHIDLSQRGLGDDLVKAFCDDLMPSLQLTTLKLAHNRLAKKGLDAVLKAIYKAPQLEELDLSGNRVPVKTARALAEYLDECQLKRLRLDDCSLDAEGRGALMGPWDAATTSPWSCRSGK